ncbi:MAG: hypothetical protein GEU91_03560 [Rhizobiales bacterium]|nr:hypothetical protein [Hyphomicrobiales bacterium]
MVKRAAKAKRAPPAKRTRAASARKTDGKPVSKVAAGHAALADAITAAVTSVTGAISADRLEQLPPELVQKLLAAAIRAYSAKVQAGERFLPFDPQSGRVSPTDIMITASGLLKAGDLQVFELGMWQSYTGR